MLIPSLVAATVASAISLAIIYISPKIKHFIEKRMAPRHVKVRVPYSVAVVDASNVVLHGPKLGKKGRIENLLMMMKVLQDRGFVVYAIADASLRHKVDRPDVLEKLIEKGKVLQVPAGTPADYFLLSLAEAEHGLVVSNDVFKEWRELFPWVKDKYRVVKYMIIGNRVFLYPDVRPKKKRKKVSVRKVICIDLDEREKEDASKYYIM